MVSDPSNFVPTRDFLTANEPFSLFKTWFADAVAFEAIDPNAMALASVDSAGLPNVRIVLMKGYDQSGFVFYTNFDSQKGVELTTCGKAAVNFHWKSLGRQVRARGLVTSVSDAEADEYYGSRPLGSRYGAWASQQSRPLVDRQDLVNAVAEVEAKYGDEPPRPPHWSGFRLSPLSIEFWQDGEYRLHDRLRFDRADLGDPWAVTKLYP